MARTRKGLASKELLRALDAIAGATDGPPRMGFEANKTVHKKFGNISEDVSIGGKDFTVRSQGEKRLAQYLELLKVGGYIKDWAFEQTTFKNNGRPFWIVDFDVLNTDGTFEYYEFKGAVKQTDILKLELLFAVKPEVQLTMVFESRSSAAKFARRKVSGQCKAIKIQSARGLEDFDGRAPKKRKRSRNLKK